MCSSIWQFSARSLNNNRIYSLSIIADTVIMISINVILISILKYGVMSLFIAYIAGKIVMIIMIESKINLVTGAKKSDFDIGLLKAIIKYSFPLCINAVSWWLISSSNSLIISYHLGVEENGIYSLANQFGAFMTLFTTVINMAWLEESYRVHGNKGSDEYFNRILDLLVRFILSGVAILIPLTYIFYQLFVFGEYKLGVVLTPIIYLNAALSAIVTHLGSGFLAKKESKVIFQTTLIGGIISVSTAFVVADTYGLVGIVAASLIGTISMFIIRVPLLKKRMNLKIKYNTIICFLILCISLMLVCNIYEESFNHQIFIALATLALLVVINKELIIYFFTKKYNILKSGGK